MSSEDIWAYIEVMGHQCVAGRVSETKVAGFTMLRVDVPIEGRRPQFINPSSIFRMTPCTEEEARRLAPKSTVTITKWMLEAQERAALPEAYDPVLDDIQEAEYEDDIDDGDIPI